MTGTGDYASRRATAMERLRVVVTQGSECLLSNVLYDAAEDGYTQPDGEGGETPDHGFDCDDLAAVLLPLLAGYFDGTSGGGQ